MRIAILNTLKYIQFLDKLDSWRRAPSLLFNNRNIQCFESNGIEQNFNPPMIGFHQILKGH